MATTIAALQKRATEIREETGISENTAERVGSLLYDLAQYMKDELASGGSSGAQAEWQEDLEQEKTERETADQSLEKKITDGDQELQDLIDSINIIIEDLRDGIENNQITFNAGFISKAESIFYDIIRSGYKSATDSAEWAWSIDTAGNILAETLRLRSFLEVPELRYNRATVIMGDEWQAPGGGIIETVTPDLDDDGNETDTGTATLHLEDGEIGAIAAGDLCVGYWHYEQGNATADSDDLKGNIQHAGFTAVYFKIISVEGTTTTAAILTDTDGNTLTDTDGNTITDGSGKTTSGTNATFRYQLRSATDATWPSTAQPAAGMHFAVFGNTTDTTRQQSVLRTKTYTRYLAGMNTWAIAETNIMMQLGDLTGLSIGGKSMEGYSAYLSNIYMSGVIDQLDEKIGTAVDEAVENAAKPALLTLAASSQVFKYVAVEGELPNVPTPESITVTATVQNVKSPAYMWETSGDGEIWVTWANKDNASTFAVAYSSFSGNLRIVRCTETTSGATDTITLFKLYDGEQGDPGDPGDDGKDAYTVILTNESHTFAAGESAVVSAQTAKCGVIAYKGTTQIAATIGTISTGLTLLTAARGSNGTTSAYITFTAKSGLAQESGTVSVPVTADGKSFTKIFSWSLSFKGKQGEQGEKGEDGLSPAANLLLGAAFNTEADLAKWEIKDSGAYAATDFPITTGQKLVYSSANTEGSSYIDIMQQCLVKSDGSVSRLRPSTWYTLSFYLCGYGGTADTLTTHLYNSSGGPVDTSEKGLKDGGEVTLISTCHATWATDGTGASEIVNGMARHSITFKTASSFASGEDIYVLFRLPAGANNVGIACPKLEIGKQATPWNIADEEKQGVDGCVCRMSEWAAGVEFRNDSALTLSETEYGVRYLDIAVIKDEYGSFVSAWQCKKTHTAAADLSDKPGSGASAATYWQQFDKMQPIYTPLLLADQSAIRFMQGTQLLIIDPDDNETICAGLKAGEHPLWIGANAAVNGDGEITAPTAFKKDGGGWLAKGNIQWDAEGNAVFAGFIQRKVTYITDDNVDEYLVTENVPTWVTASSIKFLDLLKTGTLIIFRTTTKWATNIYLPHYDANTMGGGKVSKEYQDYARSFIGNTITIVNEAGGAINVNGATAGTPTASSSFSNTLEKGIIAKYECTMGVLGGTSTTSTYEVIYWNKTTIGTPSAQNPNNTYSAS